MELGKLLEFNQDVSLGLLGRVPGQNLLYGAGCWIRGNLSGHLGLIVDGDQAHAVDVGTFGAAWQYFGFTSASGFSRFEIRDTQGIDSEARYVFADDCTLAANPPLTSIAKVSAANFWL